MRAWNRFGTRVASSLASLACVALLAGCRGTIFAGDPNGSGRAGARAGEGDGGASVEGSGGSETVHTGTVETGTGGMGGTVETGSGGAGAGTGSGTATALTGICIVRDQFSDMPAFHAPDVAQGYVKVAIPGVNDIDGLLVACTGAVFADLLAQHCAVATEIVQAEVATYEMGGDVFYGSTTCGAIGCEYLTCP